jgi:hypothetical protein
MSRGFRRPSARKDAPGDASQQARLRFALQAAFGSPDADAVEPLPGGASTAFPFCVHRGEGRYVVRLEGERSPLRNPHQYASMEIAAAAGLAPRLHYADEALGNRGCATAGSSQTGRRQNICSARSSSRPS